MIIFCALHPTLHMVHSGCPFDDDDDDDDDDDVGSGGGGGGTELLILPCAWFMQGICQSQLEVLNKAKSFAIK